jgi:hydroxyacylglutathione hydrolase
MMPLPLEDGAHDIIVKAQRGFRLDDDQLARKAGIDLAELTRIQSGKFDEEVIRRLARSLSLSPDALVESARRSWHPDLQEIQGMAQFTTPFLESWVNAYLAWDESSAEAVAFDTGTDCQDTLKFARQRNVSVRLILLTHSHSDHVGQLGRLQQATGAAAYAAEIEPVHGARLSPDGSTFSCGALTIEALLTPGHSTGSTSYLIRGLSRLVLVVGDALFAGSMGSANTSYTEALAHCRKKILSLPADTVICPGHGPMTTVGEEKLHNPFFPEFQGHPPRTPTQA